MACPPKQKPPETPMASLSPMVVHSISTRLSIQPVSTHQANLISNFWTLPWPITSTPIYSFWLFLMLDSNVLLLVSNVWLLVLNVWLLAPNVWLLASKVRHWHYMPDCLPWMYDCWNGVSECWHGNGMSDCWHPMSDCCHSMSDCWYQISYCWYRMSDWWYRTHGNSYSYLIESILKFFVLAFVVCKFCFHQEKLAYFWGSI